MLRTSVAYVLLVFLLTACAQDLTRHNAMRYYDLALRAEQAKDYAGAKEAYRRALINARDGEAPQAGISAATYGLGRMTGYTCDYATAEKLLREALELEQTLPNPVPGNLSKRLSELARLTFDEGKYQDSVAFYEQALPILEKLGAPRSDPIGYATYLEDYAFAMARNGSDDQAAQVRAKALAIRRANPGKGAQFVPLYYRDVCRVKQSLG